MLKITAYKQFEKAHRQEIAVQKSSEFSLEKALTLDNQSQLIDYVKHCTIDAMLKKSEKLNLIVIATKIDEIIVASDELKNKFFSHEKYQKENAIKTRISKHIACDKRHTDTRFIKRQISINSKIT